MHALQIAITKAESAGDAAFNFRGTERLIDSLLQHDPIDGQPR